MRPGAQRIEGQLVRETDWAGQLFGLKRRPEFYSRSFGFQVLVLEIRFGLKKNVVETWVEIIHMELRDL